MPRPLLTCADGPSPVEASAAGTDVLVAALAAAGVVRCRREAPAISHDSIRNVLLITLDTTRADRLGCYGYAGARTPRFDRLAAEGVRFENAFADAPITLPSHASILTGLHPYAHGVRNNGNFHLPARFDTLATVLGGRGYRTAAFVSSFVLDRRYGLARGFETYDDRTDQPDNPDWNPEAERRGDRTVLACNRWLDTYAAERAAAPFFVWLHLYDPHEPYRPPPPFPRALRRPSLRRRDRLRRRRGGLGARPAEEPRPAGPLSRRGRRRPRREPRGARGGDPLDVPLRRRAPRAHAALAARPPPAGKTVSSPVRTVDLAPTILDLLGGPPLRMPHGRTLRNAISGGESATPAAYAETYVPKLYMNGAALRSLRTDRFKLIEAPRPELYDLARDPGETDNRFAAEPETAARLRSELQRSTAGGETTMSAGPVDGEAAEKLKALGYLGAGGEMAPAAADGSEKDPKDLIVAFNRLRRAERAVRDRKFKEALPDLRSLVAEEPKNAFARLVLGSAYMGMRDHARAVEQLKAYTALVPTSAHGRQSLAVAYVNLGDRSAALREAAAAVALDPRLTDARLLRAGILSSQGRRRDAIEELRAGVAAAPDSPALRMSLAEVLLDAGQAKEAEAEYRAIVGPDAGAPSGRSAPRGGPLRPGRRAGPAGPGRGGAGRVRAGRPGSPRPRGGRAAARARSASRPASSTLLAGPGGPCAAWGAAPAKGRRGDASDDQGPRPRAAARTAPRRGAASTSPPSPPAARGAASRS
jgi:arylsulfatase A-like enzyme/Tfp pilus assembly protein PilF